MNNHVDIIFDSNELNNKKVLFVIQSEYMKGFTDTITFFQNKITIDFTRSKMLNLKEVFINPNHTIHFQINIALIYRLFEQGIHLDIKEIKASNDVENYNTKDINDVFPKISSRYKLVSIKNLNSLLKVGRKRNHLLISLNHYMKAVCSIYIGYKFEHYWKSFNALYSLNSNLKTEFSKLLEIKDYIFLNKSQFPMSLKIAQSISKMQIRSLLIREMILNDYPLEKTKAFKEFVFRYDDLRICEVLIETLPYREKELKSKHLHSIVKKYLDNEALNKNSKNEQILSFILIKYSYFIRNKYFHAERLSADFNLIKMKDIAGLDLVTNLYETFLYELICSFAK